MQFLETSLGKKGIPRDFELLDAEDFTIKRQKGMLLELAEVKGAKQFQVTYRDFIFQMSRVDDAEENGIGPIEFCRLYYDGVKKFAEKIGEPSIATYRSGNRLWFEMGFFSNTKGKALGNAVFATNLCTAQGNKLAVLMLNWDAAVFGISRDYVDEVLGSFAPRIRKADLRNEDAPIIGAVNVEQPPNSNSIGEILFDAANAGKKKIELEFSVVLLLDGAPLFTKNAVESEPPAALESGEVRAVRIAANSPEFPDGDYELVLSASLKGGKQLVESRMPISFSKPS